MATNSTVAEAWLKTMTALPVGDTLMSSVVPDGFAKYLTVASTPDVSVGPLGARWMRVQVDVYFSGPTQEPPWGKAEGAAEAIVRSVPYMADQTIAGFPGALINEARITDGPSRFPGDTSALARVTLDALINWTPLI
jgi:hypothetical protein